MADINKVVITEEAEFDYEEILGLPMPKADIKEACENAVTAIECGLTRGFEIAMNRYNKTQKPAQQP